MKEILDQAMSRLGDARVQWSTALAQIRGPNAPLELCALMEETLEQMDSDIEQFSQFKEEALEKHE